MERRELFKMAGAAGLVAVAPTAMATPVSVQAPPKHPLFATSLFEVCPENMIWTKHESNVSWDVSQDSIDKGFERELDIVAEIKAASNQVAVYEIEQKFLKQIRNKYSNFVYDQSRYGGTLVGDLHAKFVDSLVYHSNVVGFGQKDFIALPNTVVVGPTALTIIQSATDERFKRTEQVDISWSSLRIVGTIDCSRFAHLDRTLTVLCDPYANDRSLVAMGYVPENESERKMAMIEIQHELMVGETPDYTQDWLTIGINTDTLRFA